MEAINFCPISNGVAEALIVKLKFYLLELSTGNNPFMTNGEDRIFKIYGNSDNMFPLLEQLHNLYGVPNEDIPSKEKCDSELGLKFSGEFIVPNVGYLQVYIHNRIYKDIKDISIFKEIFRLTDKNTIKQID